MDATTPQPLWYRFLKGLEAGPDRPAIRVGNDAISYAQAHETALLWAGAIAEAKPKAVGVCAAKGATAYIGTLAALYAGAAVVPLRPDFPAARTGQMIGASGATVVIADAKGLAVLPEAGSDEVSVISPGAQGDGLPFPLLTIDPALRLDAPRPVDPDDPVYVLFTSGSTGRPKGVVLTHRGTDHYFGLLDARYDFGAQDVFTQTFDLNFDCALFDMFCAWGAGGTALVVPAQAYRDMPRFLADRGVTVWFSTPSVIDLVRRMGGLEAGSMPGLRWSFFAGEALTCRDAEQWQLAAPASTVENIYGPTELTITVSVHRWAGEASRDLAVNGVVPIGAIHEGHQHLLLGDDGEPADTEGELCVAGPQLTPGYLDPADGAGRFLDRDGRRWYRTGDRVRRVGAGELAYLGRLDSQVQVQGWRVELAEVEQAMRDCGVPDAVAVGVPGPGGTELLAFYTGEPVAPVELVRRLRLLLPDGVVPKHYRNVEGFPLNGNRKIDRSLLARRAAEELAAGMRPE